MAQNSIKRSSYLAADCSKVYGINKVVPRSPFWILQLVEMV